VSADPSEEKLGEEEGVVTQQRRATRLNLDFRQEGTERRSAEQAYVGQYQNKQCRKLTESLNKQRGKEAKNGVTCCGKVLEMEGHVGAAAKASGPERREKLRPGRTQRGEQRGLSRTYWEGTTNHPRGECPDREDSDDTCKMRLMEED